MSHRKEKGRRGFFPFRYRRQPVRLGRLLLLAIASPSSCYAVWLASASVVSRASGAVERILDAVRFKLAAAIAGPADLLKHAAVHFADNVGLDTAVCFE